MTQLRHSLLVLCTVGVVAFGLGACDSLEEDPKTFRNPDNFFRNAEEVQAAASGMYKPLVTFDLYKFGSWAESACTNDLTNCPSWFAGGMTGNGWEGPFWQGRQWIGYYNIISRANTLLKSIGDSEASEEVKDRARGQAFFLRGWSYYSLAIRYGDAPIRSELFEPSDGAFGDAERRPVHEVFQQATSDLRRAAELLPPDYSTGYQRGRPAAPAARGLLAKTYLHMGGEQFTQDNSEDEWFDQTLASNKQAFLDTARIEAEKVVEQAEGSSFPSLVSSENITDLYDAGVQNQTPELLFSIQLGDNDNPQSVEGGVHQQFFNPSAPLNLNGVRLGGGNVKLGAIEYRHRWVQAQESSDIRFETGTLLHDGWIWQNGGNLKVFAKEAIPDGAVVDSAAVEDGTITEDERCEPDLTEPQFQQQFEGVDWAVPFNAVVGCLTTTGEPGEKELDEPINVWPTYFTKKYVDLGAQANSGNGSDIIPLRYADVILVYAEALAETGRRGEAVSQLNKVRERANASTYTLGDFPLSGDTTLVEAIWAERARELYAEQDRHFDLLRQGRYFERMEEVGKSRPPRRRLFPIPEQEINGNREISTNNPGY